MEVASAIEPTPTVPPQLFSAERANGVRGENEGIGFLGELRWLCQQPVRTRLGISFMLLQKLLKNIIGGNSYDLMNIHIFFVVPLRGHARPKT